MNNDIYPWKMYIYVHKRNTLNVLFGQIANKTSIRHRTYVGDLTTISFLKEEGK